MPRATGLAAGAQRSWPGGGGRTSYRLEIAAATLLAAAIGLALWAANRKPAGEEFDLRTSTYLSGPSGSKALHEILVGLGRLSERRRTSLATLATERAHRPAVLVLLDPFIPLEVSELEQVVRYVRGGGAVVAAGDGAGVTACAGWRTHSGGLGFQDSIGVRARETDVRLPLLTPRPERPGRVVWDEYHQGFGAENQVSSAGRTWSWLRSSPAGWAILQLMAVALAWLAMTAVRFGPALSVIERRRRSPLEHVEALGAGLESAAAADTAVQRLALGLRRRLSRTGHLGSGDVVP